MFHKVAKIEPMRNQILKASFEDGTVKNYDMKPLFDKWPQFRQLCDDTLFYSVKVDQGGYGISWNDELDLACDELYYNGQIVA